MHWFERTCMALRHAPVLKRATWLWDGIRPAYRSCIRSWVGRRGLQRNFNGTDFLLLDPHFAGFPELYEPEVWPRAMAYAVPGAHLADVGAHIGLYSVAWAKRVGPTGKVWAFEPNPESRDFLTRHVALNKISANTLVRPEAMGSRRERLKLSLGGISSTIQAGMESVEQTVEVQQDTLDALLDGEKLDVLKIDVEGYEEEVLKGAANLLADPNRKPTAIFVEVHPYNWKPLGTTSDSLKDRLRAAGYRLELMNGREVGTLDVWGEILAVRT